MTRKALKARRAGKRGSSGPRHLLDALRWSCRGLRVAWREEFAFRLEACLCALLAPAAFWLGASPVERWLLLASCVLVLVVELLNSAIESVVDRIGSEWHPLSGMAKDLGAAAVFLCVLLAGAIWASALWGRFF